MNKKGYFVKTDKIIVKNEDVRAIAYVKSGNENYQIVTVRKDSILVICTVKDRKTKEEKVGISKAYKLYDMHKKGLESNLVKDLKRLAYFRAINNKGNIEYMERTIQSMLLSEVKARYKGMPIPSWSYVVYDKGLWELIGNTLYSANKLVGLKRRDNICVSETNQNLSIVPLITQKSIEDFGFVKSDMLIDIFNAIKGVI
jgi:hypothetical protein